MSSSPASLPLPRRAVRVRAAAACLGAGRGWVLFGALLSVNLGNLLFHSLAAHQLGPGSYGALASVLSILLAVSVPVSAAQVALTGEVARRAEADEEAAIGPLVRRLLLAGGAAALLVLLLAPVIRAYLHLDSAAPVVWLALYLVPLSAGVAPWASLCGRRRFSAVAAAVMAGTGVRIGVGALVLAAGGGVAGAMAATFVGELVLAGTLLLLARPLDGGARRLRLRWDEAFRGTAAVAGLWVLVAMDTILVRHYLTPLEAGTYAAASMAARGALFLPQAAAVVALPSLATTDPERARRALRRVLAAACALGALATVALTAGAGSVLPAVFGNGFQAPPLLVALLALAATGAGVLNVLVQYSIVQRSQAASAAWVGVAALPLLALLWHGGPRSVAGAALVAVAVALACALLGVRRREIVPVRPALSRPDPAFVPDLDLTVVVPFHQPGKPLRGTLLKLVGALQAAGVRFEIIAVADGCDAQAAASLGLDREPVRCVALERRYGKGEALRAGLRDGRGRYLGFIDSDGDLDPALWEPFLGLMRMYRPDAVVGSKRHALSEVTSPGIRRLYSRGYQALARLLFRLPVRDTQVGIKLFRRELLVDVLPRTVERGFVFDLELLAVARRLGYRRLLEAPVALDGREESSVRPATVWQMLVETLAVAWRLRTGRYDRLPEPTPRPVLVVGRSFPLPAPPVQAGRGAEAAG